MLLLLLLILLLYVPRCVFVFYSNQRLIDCPQAPMASTTCVMFLEVVGARELMNTCVQEP
jgi:hypothetical protein